jgi:hypothetical protein
VCIVIVLNLYVPTCVHCMPCSFGVSAWTAATVHELRS